MVRSEAPKLTSGTRLFTRAATAAPSGNERLPIVHHDVSEPEAGQGSDTDAYRAASLAACAVAVFRNANHVKASAATTTRKKTGPTSENSIASVPPSSRC